MNPTGLDAAFSNQIFRKDYPMVLACDRALAVIRPVRVVYQAGGYQAGTLLGQYTSGASSGQFAAYSNGGASGLNTAVCILFENIDDDGATGTILARGIFSGVVFVNSLVGLAAQAGATGSSGLNGRAWTDAAGIPLFKF